MDDLPPGYILLGERGDGFDESLALLAFSILDRYQLAFDAIWCPDSHDDWRAANEP